jgi:two-component system sensor histidine kinase KdpD
MDSYQAKKSSSEKRQSNRLWDLAQKPVDRALGTDKTSEFRQTEPVRAALVDTFKMLSVLVACTVLGQGLVLLGLREANVMSLYMLGVFISSLITTGWAYGLAYSLLSVFLYNFFFTIPRFSLYFYGEVSLFTFFVMFAAALVISALADRVISEARKTARKAYRTEVLLETGHKLQQAQSKAEVLKKTALQLVKLLDKQVVIYPVDEGELGEPMQYGARETERPDYLSEEERQSAQWVFVHNDQADATLNILSTEKYEYLPLRGGEQVLAVIGISTSGVYQEDLFEKNLTLALLGECVLSLQKEQFNEERKQAQMYMQQEQLRSNLLRMISHDLRTPLTSISGNASILLRQSDSLSTEQQAELHESIYEDSIWLNDLAENLLSIARIEKQQVDLNLKPELIEDVVSEALKRVSRKDTKHHIALLMNDDLLMAKMDSRLIVQVVFNLVDNAIKYTPPGSHITISSGREADAIIVEVADDGPGIRDEDKQKIFDRFYITENERGDSRRALGLGLYLCRAVIEAHGGEITVRDNDPKGAVFSFTLRAEEALSHE